MKAKGQSVQREADSEDIGGTMMLRAATLGLRVVRTGALGVDSLMETATANQPAVFAKVIAHFVLK